MGPHPFCWLSWTGIFAGPLGGSRGSYTTTGAISKASRPRVQALPGVRPSKIKTPPGPCSAREGVRMCGAPTILPEVGYGLCLPRFQSCISRRGLSIANRAGRVKDQGFSAGESP